MNRVTTLMIGLLLLTHHLHSMHLESKNKSHEFTFTVIKDFRQKIHQSIQEKPSKKPSHNIQDREQEYLFTQKDKHEHKLDDLVHHALLVWSKEQQEDVQAEHDEINQVLQHSAYQEGLYTIHMDILTKACKDEVNNVKLNQAVAQVIEDLENHRIKKWRCLLDACIFATCPCWFPIAMLVDGCFD